MPVTDTTTFRIFDTSVGAWKNITALSLKNDVADPLDWLIVYDGTTDNQWEKVDPTGFKSLTAATDYALAVDTNEKVPGTLLEAYFGGGIPANTWSMDIDTADTSWTLHTNSTCTVDVDWGDGNSEQLVLAGDTDTTHPYAAPGQYTVTFTLVSGEFRPYWNNDAEKDIVALNGTGAGWSFGSTLLFAFRGQTNLASVSADMDISLVTNLSFAWYNNSLTTFPLIDTSSVTDMSSTWYGNSLTTFPLIDTSSVTNMNSAWFGNSLTTFPLIDTSSVTRMNSAWYSNNLTAFPLIDTSSVTRMASAWWDNSLTSFPAINTSSVTSMQYTWTTNALTSFPLIDTALVANFYATWANNPQLVDFPSLNLSAGTVFDSAWQNCNLSAASIENITQALIANGRSNLTTTINGTPYADWTTQAKADYVELTTNRGWTITTA